MGRFLEWLRGCLPVTRRTRDRQVGEVQRGYDRWRRASQENHARELREQAALIDSVLDRCSRIQWRREPEGDRYSIMLQFDPRMMGMGVCPREELKFLAQQMAYRVEAEIASAKFIHSAREFEHEQLRRSKLPVFPLGE